MSKTPSTTKGSAKAKRPVVYHHPTCSTCKKALKSLAAKGVEVTLHAIAETPPSATVLARAIERSGLPAKKFFNTSGQSYRGGGWSARVNDLTTKEAAAALVADGMLIKRPLLLHGDLVLVGYKEEAYAEAFGEA